MLARVRASFDRQGMMSTLGVEVTSVEPGKVEMSLRHAAVRGHAGHHDHPLQPPRHQRLITGAGER